MPLIPLLYFLMQSLSRMEDFWSKIVTSTQNFSAFFLDDDTIGGLNVEGGALYWRGGAYGGGLSPVHANYF